MKKDNLMNIYLGIISEQDEKLDDKTLNNDNNPKNKTDLDNVIEADKEDEATNDKSEVRGLNDLIEEYENKEEITKDDIIKLLNIAVCDEILAAFNYMTSYTLSKTEGKADFDSEFDQHEHDELDHAHKLILRLREMDADVLKIGWADYLSENSNGNDWKQETSSNSLEILQNRYNEEVNAIKFYQLVLDCIEKMKSTGNWDASTERLIKSIKSDEENHELELRDLLIQYGVEVEINTSVADANIENSKLNKEDEDDSDEIE